MNLTGGIVLFAVIWFMVFFVVLPLRFRSQAEAGAVVPGTPEGAPHEPALWKKVRITTVFAVVIWGAIAFVILSGAVTLRDIDWMGTLGPATAKN